MPRNWMLGADRCDVGHCTQFVPVAVNKRMQPTAFHTALYVAGLLVSSLFASFWLVKALLLAQPGLIRQLLCCKAPAQLPRQQEDGDKATPPAEPRASRYVVSLEWKGLGCSYSTAGGRKVVLDNMCGEARAGELQALMGPSGSGKTTALDILAMRKSVGSLTGRVRVNGHPATQELAAHISYVPQDDTFVPMMTVRETLAFCAAVSLPDTTSAQRSALVCRAQAVVGLGAVGGTLVGGVLPGGLNVRGLSGGECRRLSIAASVLSTPDVLFADEPTSGLDSFAAMSVMAYFRQLADSGIMVITTIHQPRPDIWGMLDKVTLLSHGRLMYHGSQAAIVPWFESLGFAVTTASEPDWVLDLVATGFDKPASVYGHCMRSEADVQAAAAAFQAAAQLRRPDSITSNSSLSQARPLQGKGLRRGGWWTQFAALASRELMIITRNPFDVVARVLTFAWVGIMFSLLYIGSSGGLLATLWLRVTILFCTGFCMVLLPHVYSSLYGADKRVFLSDMSAKRYGRTPYYAAKVAILTPFSILTTSCFAAILYGLVGLRPDAAAFVRFAALAVLQYLIASQMLHLVITLTPNEDIAHAAYATWAAQQLIWSSFLVPLATVGLQPLAQLRYISSTYFVIEGLVQNELAGVSLDCRRSGLGADVVQAMQSGLTMSSPLLRAVLQQLQLPQMRCDFAGDAILHFMEFSRPFAVTATVLVAYWLVLHVATLAALVFVARRQRL